MRGRAPRSAVTAAATRSVHGSSRGVSPGRNAPPVQETSTGASPSSSAHARPPAPRGRGRAARRPARRRRPSASTRSGTELDHSPPCTRPTSTGYGSSSSRISGCSTSALSSRLERVQRGVDAHVAVDRRAALQPRRGVRGAAGHDEPEGERAGLRADDVEAGRLGDQGGVEGGVALERGERAEPAVLLRRDALQHDLGAASLDAAASACSMRDDRALHVDRAAAVQPPVLDGPPRAVAPRLGPGSDDVDVAVERQPAGPLSGAGDRQAPELVARGLLARMVGVRAQGREVVLVQVGGQAERGRQLGERAERRPLVAGRARDRSSAAASPIRASGSRGRALQNPSQLSLRGVVEGVLAA